MSDSQGRRRSVTAQTAKARLDAAVRQYEAKRNDEKVRADIERRRRIYQSKHTLNDAH